MVQIHKNVSLEPIMQLAVNAVLTIHFEHKFHVCFADMSLFVYFEIVDPNFRLTLHSFTFMIHKSAVVRAWFVLRSDCGQIKFSWKVIRLQVDAVHILNKTETNLEFEIAFNGHLIGKVYNFVAVRIEFALFLLFKRFLSLSESYASIKVFQLLKALL